ncbi:mannose-1-phosphate guanylyltransferase/mannose-6-phosphate isomerase [Paraburkholderia phymatum]|uniref:mannose-1-phosphate guanylyltransferase/mannose-6-phosphate isomerase n=1 Tax=Paraburkholderia phymatum TaxID=148447 RepID=UPI00316C5CBE
MNHPSVPETVRHAISGISDSVPGASSILPVVLAGGAGTRLWPLSREAHPKQLLALLGDQSMLEMSVSRLDGIATTHANRGLVVCADEHRFLVGKHLEASTREWQMIVEPVARNTAPALTLSALCATANGDDPVLVVMPADHVIDDVIAFEQAVRGAASVAREGKIVALGIVPTRAETGYGYIETGPALEGTAGHRARALTRFVEKPARETAEAFVACGSYWWNSGIFVVRASVWLAAIDSARPDIAQSCKMAWLRANAEGSEWRPDAQSMGACPSDSIDYAVMERLPVCGIEGAVVPLEAGWNDVGAWDAVWDILPKDEAGNVVRGDVLLAGASGTYAHSEQRLIACVGTTDLIVVETADAVLVADRQHAQEVKAIVGGIRKRERAEAAHHRKVQRPWGYYDSIDKGSRYQVKRIVVMPGATLSLQLHYHRSEHWIVVSGTARVTRGDETFTLTENQSTYVPIGVKHRLENPGRVPLEMIEVQCGSYLGEDDIVRFDDRYGRH